MRNFATNAVLFILSHDKIQLWSYFIIKCILNIVRYCSLLTQTHMYSFRSIFAGESTEMRWRWKEKWKKKKWEYNEFADCLWLNSSNSGSWSISNCSIPVLMLYMHEHEHWTWLHAVHDTHFLYAFDFLCAFFFLPCFAVFFRSIAFGSINDWNYSMYSQPNQYTYIISMTFYPTYNPYMMTPMHYKCANTQYVFI